PPAAQEADVAVAQGGQAVGAIAPRIACVTDAGQGVGHHRDHDRDDLALRESRQSQVAAQGAAQAWQPLAEAFDASELLAAAQRRPGRVVAILLAPARVAPGGLEVAVPAAADPDVAPGRRDGQRVDAPAGGGVADGPAIGIEVTEALAVRDAPDAGFGIRDMRQGRLPRCEGGIPGAARSMTPGRHAAAGG